MNIYVKATGGSLLVQTKHDSNMMFVQFWPPSSWSCLREFWKTDDPFLQVDGLIKFLLLTRPFSVLSHRGAACAAALVEVRHYGKSRLSIVEQMRN
mmetsp:Transcript_118570/g.236154  ORF Transcript_118570/g.236154 Transcript_118570/m.236154 type:complete len:96 (-) Transcript_118570:14-301(-)